MTDFDPDRFEDKYEHYFTELQQAYSGAFEVMSETYDSALIHEIDQVILSESEPFYEGSGHSADPSSGGGREHDVFRIEVPEDAAQRLPDRDPEHVRDVLEDYRTEIATQLRDVFDLD